MLALKSRESRVARTCIIKDTAMKNESAEPPRSSLSHTRNTLCTGMISMCVKTNTNLARKIKLWLIWVIVPTCEEREEPWDSIEFRIEPVFMQMRCEARVMVCLGGPLCEYQKL